MERVCTPVFSTSQPFESISEWAKGIFHPFLIERIQFVTKGESMKRRNFIKSMGLLSSTALTTGRLKAEENKPTEDLHGILIDTTSCVGCQTCEELCAEAHGLPSPATNPDIFDKNRQTSLEKWSIIRGYETNGRDDIFVKIQCMHCNQPACAAACPTKAMLKTEQGPVIWRGNKCMGCRFCMISCPFDVPKFEYDSHNPKIQKCNMCWDRLQKGEKPICVENCPGEALIYGKRIDLIEEARKRIYNNPDDYTHSIYGELEVGGTGYLYLASVPFDKLGFRMNLDETPYPEFTKDFLYSVPIILTLWPAFLLAMSRATKNNNE